MSQLGTVITEIINTTSVDVAAAGDNIVLAAPTKGRRIFNVVLSCPTTNGAAVTVILKFAAGGTTRYKVNMSPGQIWAFYIGVAGRCIASGADTFIANLSAAQTVFVSVEHEDF